MTAAELVRFLEANGVVLRVRAGAIDYRARADVMTPELLQALRSHKQAVIELLGGEGGHSGPAPHRISPTSYAQERLWFIDQSASGSVFYNIPVALHLRGELDLRAFRKTLNEIVRRHEVLRTRFDAAHGAPVQVIEPRLVLDVPLIDLSGLPTSEREAQTRQLMREQAQGVFNLRSAPLMRALVLKLQPHRHLVLLTLHHIVSDGWSMGVLVREVAALYDAYAQGREHSLADLPIQYADFAHWERQRFSLDVLQPQLQYWRQRLRGAPSMLALPTDRPRPAVRRHHGALVRFGIPASTTQALHALCRSAQATLFTILAAALNVLLSRRAGQSDICIGAAIANRNRAELEPLIGFFMNMVVLRTQVRSTESFELLLHQVRDTTLRALENQDVPLGLLIKTLTPRAGCGHGLPFQVLLVLQNAPMHELRLPGLRLQVLPRHNAHAEFDLTLSLTEEAGRIHGELEYDVDLFDEATIRRMAGDYRRLLRAASRQPQMPVMDL